MRASGHPETLHSHLHSVRGPRRRWPLVAGLFVVACTLAVWALLIGAWLLHTPRDLLIP